MQFFESFRRLFRRWTRVLVSISLRSFSRPRENLLAIICILLILSFNWLQGETSRLLFENELFNLSATWLFYFTPVFLFFNSFLFRRNWVKIVSAIVSLALCTLIVLVFCFRWVIGDHPQLIRRSFTSDAQIISIYERFEPGLITPGDNMYCRYRIRQKRIFLGILKNEEKVSKVDRDECRFRNERDNFSTDFK